MTDQELIQALTEEFAPRIRELCADDKMDCDHLCAGNILTVKCILFQVADRLAALSRVEVERDKLLDRAHEAQVERDCARAERDAAVEDMRGICYLCKHAEPYKFGGKMMMTCGFMRDAGVRTKNKCPDCPTFEWRGGQGEA